MHHETKVGIGISVTDYLPYQFSFGFHIFNMADNFLVVLVFVENAIMYNVVSVICETLVLWVVRRKIRIHCCKTREEGDKRPERLQAQGSKQFEF